ncbi:MAG: phosphatase PAP2 family protein [Aureispira sp.]|nr:phosphatase PAP2 family protein [Aureispira sp.]
MFSTNTNRRNFYQWLLAVVSLFALVTVVPLPLLGKELELNWILSLQTYTVGVFMDWVALIGYFSYYPLIVLVMFGLFWKQRKLFSWILLAIVCYLIVSYLLIKQTGWVIEQPARYLGARDLLELYIPEHYLGFWVGTWGFPSEHLVLTSFFVLLLVNIYSNNLLLKIVLGVYWLWICWATVYMGDHYISDCVLNACVAGLIWWPVRGKIKAV